MTTLSILLAVACLVIVLLVVFFRAYAAKKNTQINKLELSNKGLIADIKGCEYTGRKLADTEAYAKQLQAQVGKLWKANRELTEQLDRELETLQETQATLSSAEEFIKTLQREKGELTEQLDSELEATRENLEEADNLINILQRENNQLKALQPGDHGDCGCDKCMASEYNRHAHLEEEMCAPAPVVAKTNEWVWVDMDGELDDHPF